MFRERLGELYTLCPGYSFGPLSSARSFLSQSDYESLVEKANFYGSPLEFTIVGYNSNNRKVGPLMNTKWGQEGGYSALCPNEYPAGCVAIAMAQIEKYHEWPQSFDWSGMANDRPTSASQSLIAMIGKAVNMEYGKDESGASLGDAKRGFEAMGYAVSKKDHDMWDVESEIYFRGRPVYMTGDRKNFIGITWKGHAWVCDGAEEYGSSYSYFVEYLVNRSTNPSYSCNKSIHTRCTHSHNSDFLISIIFQPLDCRLNTFEWEIYMAVIFLSRRHAKNIDTIFMKPFCPALRHIIIGVISKQSNNHTV